MKSSAWIVALFLITALSAVASPARVPAPKNGFWVIVTSEEGPPTTTVRYYDLQLRLVREERIDGVRLDGSNKRTCRMLNKKLRLALTVGGQVVRAAMANPVRALRSE